VNRAQDRLWQITEYPHHPDKQLYYETIFTLGNGYLGSRAAFEEGHEGETPATLVHGIFNHAEGALVPELVNLPDWTGIRLTVDGTAFHLRPPGDNWLTPPAGACLGYERTLNLREGVLRRTVLFRAETGATVRVAFERFASLVDVNVLAQRVTVTAIDGAPSILLEAWQERATTNQNRQHWGDITLSANDDETTWSARTLQSGYRVAIASRLSSPQPVEPVANADSPTLRTHVVLPKDGVVTFEKLTSIYTSRDTQDPLAAARAKAKTAQTTGYDALYGAHIAQWATHWQASDVQIEGDEEAQIAIRFTQYHVLIAAPQHDDDVSIGAKTLSGLGYKGHVFWDTELFILSPLIYSQPHIAKNLLMYRYKRLAGARRKAHANGYEGAMFPWESTDTGEETTPQWSDPQPDGTRIRIWTGDNEQHISTDIAYAVFQYWHWTDDDAFMRDYGAEIVLDTAVFWGSRAERTPDGRYVLTNQIGPDEYHENIDNSVFVNRMAVWHLTEALGLLNWLTANAPADAARLTEQLQLTPERLDRWRDIIAKMVIPFDDKKQIHVQFDGFFDLEYVPVPRYEPRVGGVWPMLGHHRALRSQVIKQADVVMMMALLGDQTAPREVMLNNWKTYYPRCDHGSSLSPSTHAWVAARLGQDEDAYHMFHHAAMIDLQDNKGNVRDGIHGAACGGLWQAIVFGFCGLRLDADGQPHLNPRLPAHWKRVTFHTNYRGELRRFVVENPVLVAP
jgi:kojibiose phosphorylase